MPSLDDNTLDELRELNRLRDHAKDLRKWGLRALKDLADKKKQEASDDPSKIKKFDLSTNNWRSGPHPVDMALLVRVLNHRNIGDYDSNAPEALQKILRDEIRIETLFPESTGDEQSDPVPVLTAARVMNALMSRSKTVFSRASMICYYRIVRELYTAGSPDWIIGAARGGAGGRASAFVTGECIRAILAFEKSMGDTIIFLESTKRLLEELKRIQRIPDRVAQLDRVPEPHLRAGKEIQFERLALEWYVTNNLRRNVIALDVSSLFPLGQDFEDRSKSSFQEFIERTCQALPELLRNTTAGARDEIEAAKKEIEKFRAEEAEQRFNRTIYAHDTASKVVFDALREAEVACEKLEQTTYENLSATLTSLITQFNGIRGKVHRVINPAKQYIQTVLHRELSQASNPARFDAGELLFAATCFGATNEWKADEQLDEARRLLINVLPSDGRMRTNRPVHSTSKGLRLIPISFEMTRSFAHLLQKEAGPDLDSKLVSKMLKIFENPIPIDVDQTGPIGWNFQSAPEQDKPNAWVTSVAVFALDRIVRMLNDRINAAIFKRFRPDRPTELELGALIYPDLELQPQLEPSNDPEYRETPARFDGVAVGVRLQQMRAHLSRAVLPQPYSPQSSEKKHRRAFAAIFYGPPGTGKTTLAEALACTTHAPLVRLSPADLMVQGTEVVESRARVIFESLSMLSQSVIVLDEFEPVIRRRDSGKDDPAEFRFLVTGMLPKLRKLNKEAKEQSLVYCLATNYLGEVDPAAKREERFDLHIPIYHPDPISRFEKFLYQLICLAQDDTHEKEWMPELESRMRNADFWLRLGHTISRTRNVSAQSLATDFFKLPKGDPEETDSLTVYVERVSPKSFFHYVLDKKLTSKDCPEPSKDLIDPKNAQRPAQGQGVNRFLLALEKVMKSSQGASEYKSTPVEKDIKRQLEKFEEYWPRID